MRKKFWNTQQFKELQKTWEIKLEKSGFIDIEYERRKLKQNANNSYRTTVHTSIFGKQRYFELLGQGFHGEEEFKSEIEKIVMERRANGVSIQDIVVELKLLGLGRHRKTVRMILQYYERKWGIRKK